MPSSRRGRPSVIMVPLLILIVVHARRLWGVRSEFHPAARISEAVLGRHAGVQQGPRHLGLDGPFSWG